MLESVSSKKNISIYRSFYEQQKDICIYSAPWWLDAVAPGEWDVIIVYENKQIVATFTYRIHRKCGFIAITNPPFTQKLGPYIIYGNHAQKVFKKIKYENEIYREIIKKLPNFDFFMISFDQKYDNWLAFHWAGFKQSNCYSYRMKNLKQDLLSRFDQKSKRYPIQKNIKNLKFHVGLDPKTFYEYFRDAISARGDKPLYSYEQLKIAVDAARKNNSGELFYCTNQQNEILAECFVIWDRECAYYVTAIRGEQYKTSGGSEYLIYKVMEYMSNIVDCFDFAGSMIRGVEASYRLYGTEQTSYFQITKSPSWLIRMYQFLQG